VSIPPKKTGNRERAIIFDDMIDTGGTIVQAAEAIKNNGAEEVYACCTHPVLSGNAVERLNNSVVKEIIVTNSIPLSEEKKVLKDHLDKGKEAVKTIIVEGTSVAMNRFNRRVRLKASELKGG